ncbi:MAG: 2-oxoacid:ferredoxin oxidoreductase subunit beta [Nitrososphaeria archaeon]
MRELTQASLKHPLDDILRMDRIPHIWCEGCGLGTTLNCFAGALKELDFDLDRLAIVSGIGCAGRASGYVNADAFHTTHGRAIAFATGVKVANPDLKIVVLSGDGDLFAIGGNHFIHAARRNVDMLVICSNNFNYGMTGGQVGPTTPSHALTMTTPYGNIEHPFNLVALAAASGAVFVSRWTTLHVTRLTESIKKGLQKKGFSFIEVIAPCPVVYGRYNKLGDALKMMKDMKARSVIRHGIHPHEAEIDPDRRIVIGDFVDIEKPEYSDRLRALVEKCQEK